MLKAASGTISKEGYGLSQGLLASHNKIVRRARPSNLLFVILQGNTEPHLRPGGKIA